MKRSEHVEQREFVQWVRQMTPHRIFAIPNGGSRGALTGAMLKAEGVSAGVPDLYIPALHHWVEMKIIGGKTSPVQRDWHDYLRSIGDHVVVAYSKDEAQAAVVAAMLNRGEIPVRQR